MQVAREYGATALEANWAVFQVIAAGIAIGPVAATLNINPKRTESTAKHSPTVKEQLGQPSPCNKEPGFSFHICHRKSALQTRQKLPGDSDCSGAGVTHIRDSVSINSAHWADCNQAEDRLCGGC